jgi:carboxypeptidase Taq
VNADKAYEELITLSRETALLASCHQLLQWDAEICMPRSGVQHRGEQMALLAGLAHDRATDPRWAELLAIVEGSSVISDPESAAAVNVRERRRDFDRETKLPRRLVEELARVSAMSSQAWSEARDRDDFPGFAPWLEKTFELAREKADAYGYTDARYDALLEDYEPGMTTSQLSNLFTGLRTQLVPLVESLRDTRAPSTPGSARDFPLDRQREFSEGVAVTIGFEIEGGRFDLGPHPFCTFIGPGDVRIALRYHTDNFASGFLAVLHETGHALYEQGLDPARWEKRYRSAFTNRSPAYGRIS